MASNEADVLRVLRVSSELFARRSTELSELIERVEQNLSELPGKVGARVKTLDGGYLCYLKDNNEWRLMYEENNSMRYVTAASVAIKADSARALPKLLEEIAHTNATRLAEVELAIETLKNCALLTEGEIGEGK